MNLKNGEFYLSASGEIIKIVDIEIKEYKDEVMLRKVKK